MSLSMELPSNAKPTTQLAGLSFPKRPEQRVLSQRIAALAAALLACLAAERKAFAETIYYPVANMGFCWFPSPDPGVAGNKLHRRDRPRPGSNNVVTNEVVLDTGPLRSGRISVEPGVEYDFFATVYTADGLASEGCRPITLYERRWDGENITTVFSNQVIYCQMTCDRPIAPVNQAWMTYSWSTNGPWINVEAVTETPMTTNVTAGTETVFVNARFPSATNNLGQPLYLSWGIPPAVPHGGCVEPERGPAPPRNLRVED